MSARQDSVLSIDSEVLFQGRTDDVVEWLETSFAAQTSSALYESFWVSVGATGDLMTASQYLDLAT